MNPSPLRFSLTMTMGLIAGIAVNLWLFRLGLFWGIIGLSIFKHVLIAYLCEAVGVDRNAGSSTVAAAIPVNPCSVEATPAQIASGIHLEPPRPETERCA